MNLIAARHDKQEIVSRLIETYMSIRGEMKSSQRRTTEACPTDFTYSHGYYSAGLTKTDINPLKRMEAEPGVRLQLYSYKNEFLTPKP